jgi:hypothetical protein
MIFFKRKKSIDYNFIIEKLEKGDPSEFSQLLWQPKSGHVNYLPITSTLLQKFKKDGDSNDKLAIHQKFSKGNYELLIFHTPWTKSDLPYCPLVLNKKTGKIVGIMLPFNELLPLLPENDGKSISELGVEWVKFTFTARKTY